MFELFTDAGWLNMPAIIEQGYPFTLVTGARQIGKTYGSFKYCLDNHIPFIYMRRTDKELKATKTDALNPFKKLDPDIIGKTIAGDVIGFYKGAELVAPGVALSTIHNVRGISGDEYNMIIYDEFIPETIARPIRGEFDAWTNAYETLNSNRELEGREPMRMVCLANSNNAANPIFMGLRLVQVMEKMKTNHRILWSDDARGILLVNVEGSPISQKKKNQTALGKLTTGTDFARMAYENDFAFDDFSNIASKSLKEYRPIVTVGEVTIYRHKSRREYYCSLHLAGSAPAVYGTSEREIEAFSRGSGRLRDAYLDGSMMFENYLAKVLFIKYTS